MMKPKFSMKTGCLMFSRRFNIVLNLLSGILILLVSVPTQANDSVKRGRHVLRSACKLDDPPLALVLKDGSAGGSVDLLTAAARAVNLYISMPLDGFEQKFCIAVKDGNHELQSLLNEGLSIIIAIGLYDALYDKWFAPILPPPFVPLSVILKYLFFAIIPILFIISAIGVWCLRREIKRKTGYLKKEIEERKAAEEKLRRSEDALIRAQHAAKIGSWWYDTVLEKSAWTEEMFHIFGLEPSPSGIDYEEHRKIIHPSDWNRFNSAVKKASTEGIGYDLELQIIRPDGETRYINTKCVAQRDKNGRVVELVGTAQDITERKQVDTRSRQAQKMEAIGALAGGIAHDFNNILTPIIGFSEMILTDHKTDKTICKRVNEIIKAAYRAGSLVQQILAFSRQSKPQKIPVRIQTILTEAIKLARATIPSNIDIIRDLKPKVGSVSADPTQIHQVAMNLITNAYHAVEENGGKIMVALNEKHISEDDLIGSASLTSGKYALVTVSDTGIGMDQETIGKIFEPYFTTKIQGKGTGLGLSVVYGIVKEYGGDICVYSEVGQGTSFNVYLPISEDTHIPEMKNTIIQYGNGEEKILIVDDEKQIVDIETITLEKMGYQVISRTSSVEALSAFMANPDAFDMVITDMTMPSMTGVELSRELISIRPDIPIIICTGFSEKIDSERAKSIGIRGFLSKPTSRADLSKMIRTILDESINK